MFDGFDPIILARIQFAFTVSFHFFFPAFSIGLASYLMVLEGLWLRSGKQVYLDLFRFWIKIFAITFAMGVVSGIALSYQFGTNWSVFSDKTGPVIGPPMAYEVLTAQVPLLVAILSIAFWRALARRAELLPFLLVLGLFLLSFAGLGISIFPHIVPNAVTILQAAAPAESQGFMLIGSVRQ